MLHPMHRWARAIPGALALLALTPLLALAAGPPFPDPVEDQSVYDTAGMLSPAAIEQIEELIDGMEAEVGAEMVVYTQDVSDIGEDRNLENARALVDQWGIGREGFDDGVVLMIGLDPDPGESRVSLFGGSGFISSYASEEQLQSIIDDTFVPLAVSGQREEAIVETVEAVTRTTSPEVRAELERSRQINAALGLIGAPLALLGTLGWAWWKWRREGDDPELVDSPSILMAGPPAEMTPALATVIRNGRADQHTINTTLVELAGSGRISFENLDRVSEVKSDDDSGSADRSGDRRPPRRRSRAAWRPAATGMGQGSATRRVGRSAHPHRPLAAERRASTGEAGTRTAGREDRMAGADAGAVDRSHGGDRRRHRAHRWRDRVRRRS